MNPKIYELFNRAKTLSKDLQQTLAELGETLEAEKPKYKKIDITPFVWTMQSGIYFYEAEVYLDRFDGQKQGVRAVLSFSDIKNFIHYTLVVDGVNSFKFESKVFDIKKAKATAAEKIRNFYGFP